MKSVAIVAASAMFAGGTARAAEPSDRFVSRASAAEINAAYPKAAAAAKIGGEATVSCTADEQGDLKDCKVTNEEPEGFGFGQAALYLAAAAKVKRRDASGASLAGQAVEQSFSFGPPSVIVNPDWLEKPTADQMQAFWPEAAVGSGVEGRVIISCVLSVTGAATSCSVVSETPPGLGFGAASIALASTFQMKPKLRDGRPVPGSIRVPVVWSPQAKPWVPKFVVEETAEDRKDAFPKAAYDAKVSGDVRLSCLADSEGALTRCITVSEEPAGQGFADAARTLAAKARIEPKDENGLTVAGRRLSWGVSFLAPGDADPDWLKKPTAEQLAYVAPGAALRNGTAGRAVLSCGVTVEGYLENCTIASETPPGLGFGEAALQLTPQLRMTPKIRGGKAVPGGRVRIPIGWPEGRHMRSRDLVSVLLDPVWSAAPTFAEVKAAWPQGAKGLSAGQAALRCRFDDGGRLKACNVISQSPESRGFDRAAMQLMSKFRLQLTPEILKDPLRYRVDIPFRFRDPAGPDSRTLSQPTWTARPTKAELAEITKAAGSDDGRGVVACMIDPAGAIANCEITEESQLHSQIGQSALALTRFLKVNIWSPEGEPLDGYKLNLPFGSAPKAKGAGLEP